MAVDLLNYTDANKGLKLEEYAAKDAANAGIKSIEILLRMLSHQSPNSNKDNDCNAVADVTINKFRKFISVLDRNRTGHARFRRGPVTPIHQSPEPEPVVQATSTGSEYSRAMNPVPIGLVDKKDKVSVSLGFAITNKSRVSSSMGKPPLPAAMKRKCTSMDDVAVAKCGSSSRQCHCLKKSKSTVIRVVRVPAISSKVADIPADDFSWRKYGQKPIKGSPHPRGYYRCSTMKGCPAQKHVERTLDDPTMLIVTYKGEHTH